MRYVVMIIGNGKAKKRMFDADLNGLTKIHAITTDELLKESMNEIRIYKQNDNPKTSME